MSTQLSYLIIGNGITGVTAAEILRAEDPTSAITIVADDPFPVYYRPALKDYLVGHVSEEQLWARPHTFYQDNRIHFIPGHVAGIHPVQHFVQLQSGQRIGYHKLLLANGARPRQLSCPGLNLAGVTTLRTVADYQEIVRRLSSSSRIVVCGSGTLALESAEMLNQRGYQVAHLLRGQTLWSEILDPTASDLVLQEERRAGIDVRTGETIAEIAGKDGQVSEVITTGGTRLPCDMVLIAIGIEPDIAFIRASGIACGRGVQVDGSMRTSMPDIYAAGDVIEITDAITGRTRVLGQWYPAIQQARAAAYSMLDLLDTQQLPRPGVFYNATFLHGLDFVSIGLTTFPPQYAHYFQELVADPRPRCYRKVLLKDAIPLGALFLGERRDALAFKRAIDHHVNLAPVLNYLFADDFHLGDWLDRQQVPEALLHASPLQPSAGSQGDLAAFLVPLPHPRVHASIAEIALPRLSQGNIIGRQAGVTFRIEHSSVSRHHAEITCSNGRYTLRDLGSANGTFVNNELVTSHSASTLQHNDQIRFGDIRFRFQLRRPAPNRLDHEQASTALTTRMIRYTGNATDLMARDAPLQSAPFPLNTSSPVLQNVMSALNDMPNLVLITRDAEPRTISLAYNRRFTLGRSRENDITLHDEAASRIHAEIFSAPDGFYIRDLGSVNGVFVNKMKINNAYHLAHGDRIVIANTLIYCSFPQIPAQPGAYALSLQPGGNTGSLAEETVRSPAIKASVAVGLRHRTDIQALTEKRVHFEIDMCIGCNRCVTACPVPMSSQVTIAALNHATVSESISEAVTRFTHECIMCGSCVPVCPVDNHRDLLMLTLKQRLGASWDDAADSSRVAAQLPAHWSLASLINRLREQPIFSDPQQAPENYLLHLCAASKFLALEPGSTVIREGEYGRDLYAILDGQLSIFTTEPGEHEVPLGIIGHGELVGEYGMLTGQPYNVTASTQTKALVLQVPEQVMQRYLELVPGARLFFERLNNARSIGSILKRMSLFQGVSDVDLRTLVECAQVKQYDRNERLFTEDAGRPARETLHILLEGFVKVARLTLAGTGHHKSDERIIAYRQAGDYFAGGLDLLGDGRAVTVTAINRTRVAEVPRYALLALLQRYPEVNQRFTLRLQQYIESTTTAQLGADEAAHASDTTLHSLVSDGVVEGTQVLIINLDKCIHCGECEEACTRRHGQSRMNRKGMVVGNITIATACRQCQDPVCMLCSRAGIARLPNGEVYITESCIGCGICAERCPYGAISIVNVAENAEERSSWQRFSSFFTRGIVTERERGRKALPVVSGAAKKQAAPGPLDAPHDATEEMRKKVAIKCDLCAGYRDQACVEACPTGAAIRVQPTKFFGSTEEILRRREV